MHDLNKELFVTYVYQDSIMSKYYRVPSELDVKSLYAYKKFNTFGDERDYAINVLTEQNEQYEFNLSDEKFYQTGINLSEKSIVSAFDGTKPIILTEKAVYFGNNRIIHSLENPVDLVLLWDNSLAQTPQTKVLAAILNKEGFVEILNETGSVARVKLELNDTSFSVAAGNLLPNETNYLFVLTKEKIVALNKSGAIADNFPIYPPSETKFTGSITLLDYNRDGVNDILVMTEDGRLICYNGVNPNSTLNDALLNISIGYPSSGNHFVFNNNATFLLSGNDSGYVQLIQISDREKIIKWTMNASDLLGNRMSEIPAGAFYRDEFMPKERVYNWPNPVYDGKTFFRVYVSEDANVKIRIYDLNGDFVDEVKGYAYAGVDNEFEWNAKNIQSGIYYARVEANSSSKSDFKIIKVAVVK